MESTLHKILKSNIYKEKRGLEMEVNDDIVAISSAPGMGRNSNY